jgi:thiol-disulfide isomerase/thioredoxin
LGFYTKVYINRLFSFNPTPVLAREQEPLTDYDWTLTDIEGNTFNLKEKKGNVILINFWASWCPPCVAEMPDLQKLYSDYGDRVTFLFVAREQKQKASAFLKKKGYQLPTYFESGFTPRLLYNTSLPTTFILDRNGKIVMAQVGAANWNGAGTRNFLDGLLLN